MVTASDFGDKGNHLFSVIAMIRNRVLSRLPLVRPHLRSPQDTAKEMIQTPSGSGRAESPAAVPPNFDDSKIITEKRCFREKFIFSPKNKINLSGALGRRSRGRRVSPAADRSGEPSPFQNRYSIITEFWMLLEKYLN